MKRQQTIDFTRGEQLSMIREAQLTPPAGSQISPPSLKLILMTIDQYGRGRECYACQATLAQAANMSTRHIKRAVKTLEAMSLLCVTRHRGSDGLTRNHYRIVWSELALLQTPRQTVNDDRPKCRGRHFGPTDQSDISVDQSDISVDQSDISVDQGDVGVPRNRLIEKKRFNRLGQDGESFFFDDDQKADAAYVAERLARAVKLNSVADKSLVIKLGALTAIGEIPRDAVEQAIEGVRLNTPHNRAAYLHKSIDNYLGGDLNQLLKRVPSQPADFAMH